MTDGNNPGAPMERKPRFRPTAMVCGLVVASMLAGCTIGPRMYESSFNDYNDAIRKTSDGQMLANLVRMRYFESPIFLQVASVSSNFSLNTTVGATGTFNQGAANSSGLSAGAGFSESPTITFSLPESREYYGRMMAPLSADQVTLLIEAGFDGEALMRTAIRRINRLRNLTVEYSTHPQAPPSYEEFLEVFALIKKLSFEGLVEFGPGLGTTVWSAPVGPVSHNGLSGVALLATQVFAQWTAGGELIPNDKNEVQLHTFKRRMSLRFAPTAANAPDAQRLRRLLNLAPGKNAFPIADLELTKIEKGRAYTGASPAALDPSAVWPEIGIQGRSMMEIMQIASASVRVPTIDTDAGIAFVDPSPTSDTEGDWLAIRSSKDEPEDASLRIRYRDHWFYIADNDLQSREAFALLNALFAVTGGTVPGANPILTLPVS